MPDENKLKTPTQEQAEKAQKELEAQAQAAQKTAKVLMRTRYVYEVIEKATLRMMFEISFFESDPDNVLPKANKILINNAASPVGLSLRLKYLEVVD